MLRVLLALLLIVLPSAALASGGKKEEAQPYVDLSAVGLPITVNGRAVNYVFAEVRLHVAPGADSLKLVRMEPYYRDALVRAAHRQSLGVPGDWTRLDEAKVKAVLLAEARRISGPKAFSGAEVKRQVPRRVAGMLRPGVKPKPKSL